MNITNHESIAIFVEENFVRMKMIKNKKNTTK